MTAQIALTGGTIDDDAAAAAIAAVLCVLEEEAASLADATAPPETTGWQNATKLTIQGLRPSRLPAAPTWGHVERLRRAGRGGSGIVGQ